VGAVRVPIGDVQLYVEIVDQDPAPAGEERRAVLIGLHGGPGLDGAKLRYQLAPLADMARVMVPDQRGHGRSDRGAPETWNLATWAADVKHLSDALRIEHPVVLGTSFGSFVAQQYAATYPEHAAGLILMSAGARFGSLEETAARFHQVGGQVAADAVRRDWETPSAETSAEWERVCEPLLSLRTDPDPLIADIEAARIRTIDVNLHFMREGKAMDLRDCLGAVRCPTLVVVGEHDPLVPIRLATEIVDAIPDGLARIAVIGGAAHEVLTDNPEATYRVVRKLLADLARA